MPIAKFPNQTTTSQSVMLGDSSEIFSVVLKSPEGCTDTATVKVIVDPNSFSIYVPNVFTPNGDGKNDVFLVYGPSINLLEMRIFNQWGQQIYTTNDKTRGWNGFYNGQQQPAGVYIYVVKATLYNGTVIAKKGTLLLIR
jgi:gliding motility-associated-like protein